MKYMLLIYADRAAWGRLSEEERQAASEEYLALSDVPGMQHDEQLQPAETATTVRVADGEVLTTDGPFVEAKEELGGYYLLEAESLDAAMEVASRVPAAGNGGAVEVRPVVEH